MSKYLIDDQPLIVLPKLAKKIGLNESLFLQQIHYWLLQKKNVRDGYYWTYNSYPKWLEQFPFWSESTLKRTVTSLENKGLIISGNYNSMKIDKTKWYRINYEKFKEITNDIEEFNGKASNDESVQNDPTNSSKRTDEDSKLNRPLPEITTENTTKNKDIKDIVPAKADTIPYETIVEHLNLKTGKNFKHQTPATRKLIKARWNEGNELDEFKKVIDTMVHNWKDDLKMKDYLQPSTLFSTKFENYLNQEKKQTFTNQQQNKAWEDDIYGNSTNSYDYGYNQQQLSKPNEQNRQQIILQQP